MSPDAEATGAPDPDQMSEEELRRRLAEELKKVLVRDVLLQNVVTLINIGGQRLGLGDAGDARDLGQARLAIEAVRLVLPLIEERAPGELAPLRDALAQLQMAYAHEAGAAGAGGAADQGGQPEQPAPGGSAESAPAGPGPPAGGPDRPGGIWTPPGSQT